MRSVKLIGKYVLGSRLDRITIQNKILRKIDLNKTYEPRCDFRFKHLIDTSCIVPKESIDDDIFKHYMKHEYNFLGLGWTNWNHSFEDISKTYHKIAWSKDIRSGYDFSMLMNTSNFIKNVPQGTDIKIPWELARMQHWPQIAIYGLKYPEKKKKIQREFQNQMEDFMESNPLGAGIHFFCAMEMAIRVINLMIAYDIISQYGSKLFSNNFVETFEIYIYAHLQMIINRLEKNFFTGHTGNHYLADLCGLLWICMYFDSAMTKKIVNSVIEELKIESKKQFTDSGSSFECSTGYHLLAAEILALSFFAVGNIDSRKIQDADLILLSDIRNVINIFEARDHRIIQIGDNDSGRVLKLYPLFMGEKEDCLNPSEVKSLLNYIVDYDKENMYGMLLNSYHSMLANRKNIVKHNEIFFVDSKNKDLGKSGYEYLYEKIRIVDINIGFIVKTECLSDFGLVKVRCENADIYIRTVPEYKKMNTSHAHDDVFSYQIVTDERRIYEDLGSIVYTSDKKKREYFAGAQSHNVPIHTNIMVKRLDTFKTSVEVVGRLIINDTRIIIEAKWDGVVHQRIFEIRPQRIVVKDYSNESFELIELQDKYYSLGYGQLYLR